MIDYRAATDVLAPTAVRFFEQYEDVTEARTVVDHPGEDPFYAVVGSRAEM